MNPPLALITGTASGIGRCTAERLIREGWQILGIDQADPTIDSPRYQHHIADLATDPGHASALQAAREASAPVQAVVHAAGIMRADDHPDIRADGGLRLWRLHVLAAHRLIEDLAPQMPDRHGRIVLVGSRAAAGRAGRAIYAGSKAALNGVARSWAAALIARGITVNIISPGSTDTPMLRDPARIGAPVMPLPIGRLIQPDEIAAWVSMLLGETAGTTTGQTIVIDGGVSLA
ncbi:MAG: SDR family oxidoreductase [Burkholderiaceae bacterium]